MLIVSDDSSFAREVRLELLQAAASIPITSAEGLPPPNVTTLWPSSREHAALPNTPESTLLTMVGPPSEQTHIFMDVQLGLDPADGIDGERAMASHGLVHTAESGSRWDLNRTKGVDYEARYKEASVPHLTSLPHRFAASSSLLINSKSNMGGFLLSFWFAANDDRRPHFVDMDEAVDDATLDSNRYFCKLQWGSRAVISAALCPSGISECTAQQQLTFNTSDRPDSCQLMARSKMKMP